MKNYLFLIYFSALIFFFIVQHNNIYSQPGQWTWIHGSNTGNNHGNYGVQGIPSQTNEPPAVYEPCEWTDLNGNFWFYGGVPGFSLSSVSNDLWKYDPQTNEWTWISGSHTLNDPGNFGIKGVASSSNRPPGLGWGITSWTDLTGDLWLLGGHNTSLGTSSDLWKYNIASNQWTWMKGPGVYYLNGIYGIRTIPDTANYPPAKQENSTSWTDNSGNLWFFGGGFSGMRSNDLWRYNIASNTWTWMNGSNQPIQPGVWGIKGVEDSLNVPSARFTYSHWVDNSDNFWLFGGMGLDAIGNIDFLEDLWKYNPLTNNWTWMNGNNIASLSSRHYGTRCITDSLNQPPARYESRAVWKDSGGNFLMFGGNGSIEGNDLWKYCVVTNNWTWISGDTIDHSNGNYGVLGVSSITNIPPTRYGSVGWSDNSGHLFLFAGRTTNISFNDLWRFEIDTACAPCAQIGQSPQSNFTVNNSSFCAGTCVSFTNLSQFASSYQWSFPGGIPSSDTTANPPPVCYFNSGNYSVTLTATNNVGTNSVTTNNMITVFPAVQFSAIVQSGDTLFSVPGFVSYQWNLDTTPITGANNFYYVATQNGDYSVQVVDSNGCSASATLINVLTLVENNSGNSDFMSAWASDNVIYIEVNSTSKENSDLLINDAIGQIVFNRKIEIHTGENKFEIPVNDFSNGIYYIKIRNEKSSEVRKVYVR